MVAKRILFFLALGLAVLTAGAASMAQRSPFFQGHWWDPARSGHGFEIFNASGTVMVVWYTYDAAGKPIWYTAQGPETELGQKAWPLQSHRWGDGRIAQSTTVGEMMVAVAHSESIGVGWRLGDKTGGSVLRPYIASTLVNEVDRTGHWYDPTRSGWGFTLTEQGDTLGSVLYAYDPSGAPTWIAGFGRGQGRTVEFHATTGTCPSCPYAAISTRPLGSVTFDYVSETELVLRPALNFAFAPGVSLEGAVARQLGRPASHRAADRQLAHFVDDAALKAYLAVGMLNMTPMSGGIDFSAAPPRGPGYSPTNLQEEGVDEAGLVKTDGRFIYTFEGRPGYAKPVLRVAEVSGDGAALAVKGVRSLAGGGSAYLDYRGLLVKGTRLAAITATQPDSSTYHPWAEATAWSGGETHIELLDATESGIPNSVWHARVGGHVLATRRIGDRLFVVSRFAPYLSGFQYGVDTADNRTLLAATPLASLLPQVSINGGPPQPLAGAQSVYAMPLGARRQVADIFVVMSIDMTAPAITQAIVVAGSADAVYVSTNAVYLASARDNLRDGYGRLLPGEPPYILTDVHRIDLASAGMVVAGTGTVEGSLDADLDKAQMRMSEHDNRLRVVTNSFSMWGAPSNRVTVLEPSSVAPGLLKTVGWLPNAQRPEPLGKPGERLHATRFAGERLYAVTFQQVDPLYVVDLSVASDPRIVGALEVPGFSEYLHPLPTGQLIGFGREGAVWQAGLHLSLYNVSASGAPTEVQRFRLGRAYSSSGLEKHHHALSALLDADGSGKIAFPARIHEGTPNNTGYYPWFFSGLLQFNLRFATPTELRLEPTDFLYAYHKDTAPPNFDDAAADDARSILFPNGTVYVGFGRFWHQDAAGVTIGPL